MLMGYKFLIKLTRPQNIIPLIYCFVAWSSFIKNFDSVNIRKPWAPDILKFFSKVIMTKRFIA